MNIYNLFRNGGNVFTAREDRTVVEHESNCSFRKVSKIVSDFAIGIFFILNGIFMEFYSSIITDGLIKMGFALLPALSLPAALSITFLGIGVMFGVTAIEELKDPN